jgi:hypothetical protein
LKKCQRQQFAFCPFRLQLYGAKAGWSLHCISCFQGLNKHFLKVKKCAWLIFTGRIVLLPDVASVRGLTNRKENIDFWFVQFVHQPNQFLSCGRAGRIGKPQDLFMACREDCWQGNGQVRLHLFFSSINNVQLIRAMKNM